MLYLSLCWKYARAAFRSFAKSMKVVSSAWHLLPHNHERMALDVQKIIIFYFPEDSKYILWDLLIELCMVILIERSWSTIHRATCRYLSFVSQGPIFQGKVHFVCLAKVIHHIISEVLAECFHFYPANLPARNRSLSKNYFWRHFPVFLYKLQSLEPFV